MPVGPIIHLYFQYIQIQTIHLDVESSFYPQKWDAMNTHLGARGAFQKHLWALKSKSS